MSELEVRRAGPADADACLALHRRAFGDRWDRDHWRWRFEDERVPAAEVLGAFDGDDRCLAMFTGARHRCVLDGGETLALQHGDVAVDPDLRHGLGGSGLLARVGRGFFDTFGGGSTLLHFGFPEPALRRLVVRHMRSEVLEDLVFLVRPASLDLEPPPNVEVAVVDAFGGEADALWERCRPELGAALVRDARYLNWRFRDHPDVDYTLLEARDRARGELRGLAVLREGGWDPAIAAVSEWLAPAGDELARRALVHRALTFADERGKEWLVAWFPAPSPEFHRFQVELGFFARGTPYQQLFRSWANGIDRRWLHERWYRTMGDIDFF